MVKKAAAKLKLVAQKLKGLLTSWSFSRWNDYNKCPYLAKLKHVEKRREPENAALIKGNLIHQLAEQFVRGDLKQLPAEFGKVKARMLELRKLKAQTEQSWTVDRQWQLCNWDDWNRAWLRMKIDVHYLETSKKKALMYTTVCISDYKTGKEQTDHALQEGLYAIGAFAKYPQAQEVKTQFIYTDSGHITKWKTFKPKDVALLMEQWELRTRAMLTDTVFRPKPGDACRWCFFRKSNGGPCQY